MKYSIIWAVIGAIIMILIPFENPRFLAFEVGVFSIGLVFMIQKDVRKMIEEDKFETLAFLRSEMKHNYQKKEK